MSPIKFAVITSNPLLFKEIQEIRSIDGVELNANFACFQSWEILYQNILKNGFFHAVLLDISFLDDEPGLLSKLEIYPGMPTIVMSEAHFASQSLAILDIAQQYHGGESPAVYLMSALRILSRQISFRDTESAVVELPNGARVNLVNREVFFPDRGEMVILTNKEAAILHVLVRHEGTIVSKESIIGHVWRLSEESGNANSERVNLHRMCRKLGENNYYRRDMIKTFRDDGYMLLTNMSD